jgi:hypothetical protein
MGVSRSVARYRGTRVLDTVDAILPAAMSAGATQVSLQLRGIG